MSIPLFEQIHRVNYLVAELDALYHQAALKIGMADSAMRVLYTIYDNGESCMLSDICKQSCISKQTVNSALRKLEAEGIVYLEQQAGKTKRVCLTDEGKAYAKNTAARLFDMECQVFASWQEGEVDLHVSLMEKYVESFRRQLEVLQGEN